MSKITFNVTPGRRILLLFLTYVLGVIITGFISMILLRIGGDARQVAMTRIATVVQDIVMLILPALATAIIVTRRPAALLALDRKPRPLAMLMAIVVLVVSSPLMTAIVNWNESIELPESMSAIATAMREMESQAAESIKTVMGPHTWPNLVVNILLIGILAGVAEELFFRGALQRLLRSMPMSQTAAIWIAATVFSAVHFQFYGFVPRLLLGAYFGYLLVWSGTVWLPVVAHAFNNIMFVTLSYVTGSGDLPVEHHQLPQWIIITCSLAFTAVALKAVRDLARRDYATAD